MIILLLVAAAGSSLAAFNFSEVSQMVQKGPQRGLEALESLGAGAGDGFYMAIYQDTVANPSRLVEEQIQQRFGIDFRVDLSAPKMTGQYTFLDFFEDPTGYHQSPAAPTLKQSLQSDCVRIKTAQADDEERRWALVKRRLGERQQHLEDPQQAQLPSDEQIDREVLTRLIGLIDTEAQAQLDRALDDIPEYRGLGSQSLLLRCYEDFSAAVDFELKLQTLLHPSRKQLEALQTFVNGRLDDFSSAAAFTDIGTGSAFPKYDLLFDIDVIDFIIFGSPIATDITRPGQVTGDSTDVGRYGDYQDIVENSVTASGIQPPSSSPAREGGASTTSSTSTPPAAVRDLSGEGVTTGGFGTSSLADAGPYCVAEYQGISLDFSALDPIEETPETGREISAIEAARERTAVGQARERTAATTPATETGSARSPEAIGDLPGEGKHQLGKNRQALCEGTTGFDFGNDMIKLIFCVDIAFEKVGKTWQTTREADCLACQIAKINQTFEERVLKTSVRPHKNTGTVMESALCEDAFGDDIGFFNFIEWVPVKFYDDICYPQGGVTDESFAELVGYPEIVLRVNRPGFYVSCDVDFKEEKAIERCREAIGGNELSYEEFQSAYLSSLNQKITSPDQIDKETNVWAKLVGDQGIAQRELHFLLYQMGKDEPQYGEEEGFPQDYKIRLDYLERTLAEIQRDNTLVVDAARDQKAEQLICLKGFAAGRQQGENRYNCREYEDTFREFERDVHAERERVSRLLRRWNQRSRDFNGENSCGVFTGSGPVDAFFKTFEDRLSPDYFLTTNYRKTQTPEEQITQQIAANTEIEDLNRLFFEINQQVEAFSLSEQQHVQQEAFQSDQERSLQLYTALGEELANFRSAIRGLTDWWAEMINNKQFISKGGERINVLESYFEKLQ